MNADAALAARFVAQARAARPLAESLTPEAIFAGLEWRRLRVRQDQQAPEWAGLDNRARLSRALRPRWNFDTGFERDVRRRADRLGTRVP